MRQFRSGWICLIALVLAASPAWSAGDDSTRGGDTFAVGPGDVIRVVVFQNTDLTLETRVDDEGRITYPFLGALDVAGRSPSEVERVIAAGLTKNDVLRRPQVSVVVTQYRSRQISVLGNVNRPGRYPLDLPYTLSDALAVAGGVAPGGADTVVLSRVENGKVKNSEIDLVQMFSVGGKRSEDVILRSGDVLYVHRAPAFYIYGEVQRPGMFRLERDMTLMQGLSAGGGLTPRGTERGIRVSRRVADGSVATIRPGNLQEHIAPDDVIYVQESLF